MERDGLTAFDLIVVASGCVAFAVGSVVWGGAALAARFSGEGSPPTMSDAWKALPQLPEFAGNPAHAWPEPARSSLPGPIAYWACTAVALVVVVGLLLLIIRVSRKARVGSSKRKPLGVDARPRFATHRDLRPLLVRSAVQGRFVVARFGRALVATEDAERSRPRGLLPTSERHRRGDRGAVALIGPSRSGKTTAVVSGILEWDGPAILSSVKADLLGATRGWRSSQGDVRIYDPTSSTVDQLASALWSPLQQAGTVLGAQRAARALCDAAPKGGVEGGMDFWLSQAEILLSGLLFVAHHAHRDMAAVCEWILLQDCPGDLGSGEVRKAIDVLLASDDPAVAAGALEASKGILSAWEQEERTKSSIYSTAQTVVWPWSEPGVAASAKFDSTKGSGGHLDLDWLMSGSNTVYLCSPIEDQRRLAPAFGGLLNDLINQAYRHVAKTGKPLDPPLLVVIDEAGNTPLRSLPEYASTLAGIGILLVTIWQSLAQVEAAYSRQADTILTNHLTKCFYAGLSDPTSLRYVDQVLGDAEVETKSRSTSDRSAGGSDQYSTTRSSLAPSHALRQMRPGDALLIHGTLPPAHVRTRPFYRDKELKRRADHSICDEKETTK